MKSRTLLFALTLLGSASAQADHNWRLDSYYDYTISGVGDSRLHDVEEVMDVAAIDDSYFVTVSSSFDGDFDFEPGAPVHTGQGHLSLDTYPWISPSAAEPELKQSFLFGVIDDLPGDTGPTQHLVLFVNNDAASYLSGRAYESVFDTSTLSEQDIIDATLFVHTGATDAEKAPYYQKLDVFRNSITRNANFGDIDGDSNDDFGSVWFTPGTFSIVSFSDGSTIGTGQNSVTTQIQAVPEPASVAALGVGAVALLHRRRKL